MNGADTEKKKKSWRQVNASATMIGDERPSPPLHNQHIVTKAHQCMNPENKAWKHHVPPHSALPAQHGSLLLCLHYEMGARGVLHHMRLISLRGPTLKLRHYTAEATAANGTRAIQIGLRHDQSDKRAFAIYQAFTSQTLKVDSVMMLASE